MHARLRHRIDAIDRKIGVPGFCNTDAWHCLAPCPLANGVQMAAHNAMNDYESTLKILSILDRSKPIALVTISQSAGIKYADIIRLCTPLIHADVIKRVLDSGNIYYTLLTDEYEAKVAEICNVAPPEDDDEIIDKRPRDSREAIMIRRAMRASGVQEKVSRAGNVSAENESIKKKSPERLSAYDLYAMKRSSPSFARPSDLSRSSQQLPSVQSSAANPAQSRDANRRLSSSTTHKAVYINKPGQRRPDSRSSFNIIPPAFADSEAIERSDGVFKQTNPTAGRAQVPIIPDHALSSANNDIPEDELRDALQIRPDAPLITILSPRPCHEVWAACSALANTSGGYLVLGLRRYEKSGIVSYYPKSVQNPEDAIKNIYKSFNDRNIISDCPKDPSFITASQIRNKNIIVMHIDPAQFAPAPLYTTRDSFGMKTNQGCYLLIEGKIVHCTQDDVKNLWQQKRLGNDIPDWTQTSEQADIEMRRKISIHLPPVIDDAVRPLSRKTINCGKPVGRPKLQKHVPVKRAPEDMYEGERLLAAGRYAAPTTETHAQFGDHQDYGDIVKRKSVAAARTNSDRMLQPSLFENLSDSNAFHKSTVQNILFAEDFNIPSPDHFSVECNLDKKFNPRAKKDKTETETQPAKKRSPRSKLQASAELQYSDAQMPKKSCANCSLPLYEFADRDLLSSIAQPVVDHPRLPMTRVCEIAKQLCARAQFTMQELGAVLNKKPAVIKDKVVAKLREDPNFAEENGVFYIRS